MRIETDDSMNNNDYFEIEFRKKERNLESLKGGKKPEEVEKKTQAKKEDEIDADENIGAYYNYTVKTKAVIFLVALE